MTKNKNVTKLDAKILMNMTRNIEPHENAIAERVNDIMKNDFRFNRVFNNDIQALSVIEVQFRNHNNLRSYMSYDYVTTTKTHELYLSSMKKYCQ